MIVSFIIFEGPPKIGGISSWILNIKYSTSADCLILKGNYLKKMLLLIFKIIKSYFNKDILVLGDFINQCLAFFLFLPRSRMIFVHHGPGTYKYSKEKSHFLKFKNNMKGIIHKKIFNSSIKHVFVSKTCLEIIKAKHKVKLKNFKIINNGFPKSPRDKYKSGPSLEKNCLNIIYAGRDHPLKNVNKVYELSRLISKYIRCQLTLCGVEREFKNTNNLSVLSFGNLSNKETKQLIKNSDISIFLSDFPEANPLFLIESMHYGLGIISNKNEGSLETLKNYPAYILKSNIRDFNYKEFSNYLKEKRKCYSRTCEDQVQEIKLYATNE